MSLSTQSFRMLLQNFLDDAGFSGQEATNVRTLTNDTGQFSHVERLLVAAAFLWSQKTVLPSF